MWGGMAILKKTGGKCVNTHRPVGHVPRKSWDLQFLRPGRKQILPGQLCYRLIK